MIYCFSLSKSKTSNHLSSSLFSNRRHDSSDSMTPTPSSGEINIDDLGPVPTVTSPLGTDMTDFPDWGNHGQDGGEKTGLHSPGLVSTMSGGGYTLANSSPLNNFAAMKSPGTYTSSNVVNKEERKTSSSSSVMKKTSSTLSGSGNSNNVTSHESHETNSATESFKRYDKGHQVNSLEYNVSIAVSTLVECVMKRRTQPLPPAPSPGWSRMVWWQRRSLD